MGPYLYMTKIKLLMALNYRSEFFINLLVQVILLFTTALFWKAAYKGIDTVEMVNEQQMLVYSIISIILTNSFGINVENALRGKVRMGSVAVDYIKPVKIFLMYFSEDIGNVVTSFIQNVIPIFIFSSLFIIVPKPASTVHFLLFLVSSVFSYMILWFIAAIFGLFYFRVIDMGPVGGIKDYLIKILSGTFVPIWFFPTPVQNALQFLPFIYTYQLPISIFIGRASFEDAVKGMLVQIIWILIFGVLFMRLKKSIEKNIFVQGG